MSDQERERAAAVLGRHYVAGHLEADAFSARVDALYAADGPDAGIEALAGLPALEAEPPAPVRSRRSWRRARHGESETPHPDWLPTPERFLDPSTDRVVRVWLEPGTRTRHYVPELGA